MMGCPGIANRRGHFWLVTVGLVLIASGSAVAANRPAAAADVELEDYIVQRGDTCYKIAVEHLGDARRLADIHAHNEMGPSPHHLRPGSILRLPRVSAPHDPDARITFVRNRVDAFKPQPKPAEVNETLFRGHKVGTKEQSSTELLFADQTRIQLGEQTLIVVLGGISKQADMQTRAETTLLTGALRARLGELAGSVPPRPALVKTDAAEISLGPGEAQVHVDEKKATRLAVYRGRSSARAKRKTVEVPEGFGNKTEVGKEPEAPKPLPPAPAWIAAPPAELAVTDTAIIVAKYGPGQGTGPAAAQWRVQIARDEAFNDLVVDVRVPVAITDLEAKALVPGVYLTRVSAIDADAFEGPFGVLATTKVTVAPPPPPPPPPPPALAPPAPPPPAPPRSKLMFAGAALGGLDLGAGSQGWLGPAFGLEFDVARRPAQDAFFWPALGIRALYEHLGSSSMADTQAVSRRDGLDLALLVMLRLGKPQARLSLYAALAPQLAMARVREVSGRTFNHAWLAGALLAGVELRLGPGRVLFEIDGRYPTRRPIMSTDAQLGFLHLLLGYRVGF
jgi:hypothetical protein